MAGVRSMLDHCSSKTINPGLYFHQCPGSEPGTTGRDNAATISPPATLPNTPNPPFFPFPKSPFFPLFSFSIFSHFSPSIFLLFPFPFSLSFLPKSPTAHPLNSLSNQPPYHPPQLTHLRCTQTQPFRVCQNIGQPSIISSINGFRFFKKFTLS